MRTWKAPAAAILATAMALLLSPSPSNADNRTTTVRLEVPKGSIPIARIVVDGSRKPISNYTVRTETTSDKQYRVLTAPGTSNADYCELFASPAPTYSATNHWMFWGGQIICNDVTHLRIRMVLLSGPNGGTNHWQDSAPWSYKIGAGHSYDRNRPCLDWGSFTYWKLQPYAEVDWDITNTWIPFTPYSGYVPPRWQECIDI